jgi:hypothetical protein
MLRLVTLVKPDVSEERIASIIRVTRIIEQRTLLAVTTIRSTLWRNTNYTQKMVVDFVQPDDGGIHSSKNQFYQGPRGIRSQKTAFFMVTAVKTPNLTQMTGIV